MDLYNEYILESHLEVALRNCDFVIKRGEKWQFRCNICLDSKKSKSKRRGWLLKNRNGIWIFNCFNQCGSMGAALWLKTYFPEDYKNYIHDLLSKNRKEIKKKEPQKYDPKIERPKRISFPFLAINAEKNKNNPLVIQAKEFCLKRRFPKDVWTKFFVCEEGKYTGRLIIPFYNQENRIYYFQARILNGDGEKYISALGEKKIYNIFNVDKSKPVMVTEGMVDSMFLENAIAIVGLRMSESVREQLKGFNPYFLLDSDESGQRVSLELLKQGHYVFNWYKFKRDKGLTNRDKWDINEVVLYLDKEGKFTFEELKNYFTNNVFDSIYFG